MYICWYPQEANMYTEHSVKFTIDLESIYTSRIEYVGTQHLPTLSKAYHIMCTGPKGLGSNTTYH